MYRIMIAVDGSDLALDAVRHGIALVRRGGLQATLVLGHVQEEASFMELATRGAFDIVAIEASGNSPHRVVRNVNVLMSGLADVTGIYASRGRIWVENVRVDIEAGARSVAIDLDQIDEERRLAYVGITRAQRELVFTLCRERRQYGELIRPVPSRFLQELPQDDLDYEGKATQRTEDERRTKGAAMAGRLLAMLDKK